MPKAKKPIDFEVAKAKKWWFELAKKHCWSDTIRDSRWIGVERSLRASRMREAKVIKHDESRTLLQDS